MVARSESTTDRTRVGGCGGVRREGESRVFRCKTCLKEFSSFQALGGHSVSHKKHINKGNNQSMSSSSTKPMTWHTCPICGAEFHLGQALGGHMRKHRNQKEKSGEAFVTRSFLPEEPSMVTTLNKSSSGKRVTFLDLGLADSVDSFVNLKLELGLTIT